MNRRLLFLNVCLDQLSIFMIVFKSRFSFLSKTKYLLCIKAPWFELCSRLVSNNNNHQFNLDNLVNLDYIYMFFHIWTDLNLIINPPVLLKLSTIYIYKLLHFSSRVTICFISREFTIFVTTYGPVHMYRWIRRRNEFNLMKNGNLPSRTKQNNIRSWNLSHSSKVRILGIEKHCSVMNYISQSSYFINFADSIHKLNYWLLPVQHIQNYWLTKKNSKWPVVGE